MKDLIRVKANEPVELIKKALANDGAVIVEGFLTPDLLERFNAEVEPLVGQAESERAASGASEFVNDRVAYFFGSGVRHVTLSAVKSPIFATEILPHPLFLAVCDAVLLPNCARYQLNLAHVLVRGPGADEQALHRDQDAWSQLPCPHPEVQLASIVALVDFTADNGATRLIPGSHRWPPDRAARDDELAVAEMPAGSAVIYLGSTAHGGGANVTTDEWRRGIHISYSAGWLRSAENQFLLNPVQEVRSLPRLTQELLGYAAHDAISTGGGYIGTVDLQDPIELIAAGSL